MMTKTPNSSLGYKACRSRALCTCLFWRRCDWQRVQQDAVLLVLLPARNVDPRSIWWDPRRWPVKQHRLARTSSTSAPQRRGVRLQGGCRIRIPVRGIARAPWNAKVPEHVTYKRGAGLTVWMARGYLACPIVEGGGLSRCGYRARGQYWPVTRNNWCDARWGMTYMLLYA